MNLTIRGVLFALQTSFTKQGSPYVVATIYNKDGKHSVSIWGATPDMFQLESVIEVSVKKSEDGFLSCTTKDFSIAPSTLEDLQYLPHRTTKEEWDLVWHEIAKICPIDRAQTLFEMKEYLYPILKDGTCALQHHHVGPGGLLTHTYELLNMFVGLYPRLPIKVNPLIVVIACAWHDFGKTLDYTAEGSDYAEDFFLIQHPVNSANACAAWLEEHQFNTRMVKFIYSAILSHHMKQEWGAPIVPANPESFVVAMLDQLSGFGVQYDVPTNTKSMGTKIQRY